MMSSKEAQEYALIMELAKTSIIYYMFRLISWNCAALCSKKKKSVCEFLPRQDLAVKKVLIACEFPPNS